MKENAFLKWIRLSGGSEKVASRLGVTPRAVRFWVQGVVTPSASTIQKIVKASRGKVTVDSIIFARGSRD